MLANASIIGFIPVTDLQAAEQFFSCRLGLAVVARDPFALVVAAAAGQTIRCVPVPGFKPQAFTILGWEVPDIHVAVRGLRAAGIEPIRYPHFEQDADGVWSAPGGAAYVVWFNDPDGNILSVSQHAARGHAQ